MVRARLMVLRLRRCTSDTFFEVYGDLGSGEIDYDHALSPGPVRFWPEAGGRNGHVHDAHLVLRHLDSVDPDGHFETLHLDAEHLRPAWPIIVESPSYVFGRFNHAVKVFDGAGNVSSDPPAQCAVTVNAAPAAPRVLKCVGYDEPSDQVTFSFHGIRFEPIRGV